MGLLGDLANSITGTHTGTQDRASRKALEQAAAAWNIPLPELSVAPFQGYEDLGGYTPVEYQAAQMAAPEAVSYELADPRLADIASQGPSAFEGISVDPRLAAAQNASLGSLDEIIAGGGLTAADLANLNKVQSEVAQADRGRREAILQNASARGMGGSGQELLAQLSSGQAATNRANQSGLDIAGMSQQRALDAIMSKGSLAGDMRNQAFGEDAKVAAARDAISQFNTSNLNTGNLANANIANQFAANRAQGNMNAASTNVGNRMAANQANMGALNQASMNNASAANTAGSAQNANAQRLADLNTRGRNTYAQDVASLSQQNFENQKALAAGKSGGQQALGQYFDTQAARKAAQGAQELDAIIKGGTAVYNYGAK